MLKENRPDSFKMRRLRDEFAEYNRKVERLVAYIDSSRCGDVLDAENGKLEDLLKCKKIREAIK